MGQSGQLKKVRLRSVKLPRVLASTVLLASAEGRTQRLAWSIVSACRKVKLEPLGSGADTRLAYVIEKKALQRLTGTRLDNAQRDLTTVLEKAVMRSHGASNGRQMFKSLQYLKGQFGWRGGKVAVDFDDEALALINFRDLVDVPEALWKKIATQVGFALLVWHYADQALDPKGGLPSPEVSRFAFMEGDLGWWGVEAKKGDLARFRRDHLVPAIISLAKLESRGLLIHQIMPVEGGLVSEAVPVAMRDRPLTYALEPGDQKETPAKLQWDAWSALDVDARKSQRAGEVKRNATEDAKRKRATDTLRAEIRPKLEEDLKAEVEAKLRVELEAKLRAEYAARIEREGVAWLAKTGPAPVAVAKPVNTRPPRRPGLPE